MLARIRNAQLARHERARCRSRKLKVHIAEILKPEGFIADVTVQRRRPRHAHASCSSTAATVRAPSSACVASSRPGRRVYVEHTELPPCMSGMGISILSTSRGVMTDSKRAASSVGGELLCEVW